MGRIKQCSLKESSLLLQSCQHSASEPQPTDSSGKCRALWSTTHKSSAVLKGLKLRLQGLHLLELQVKQNAVKHSSSLCRCFDWFVCCSFQGLQQPTRKKSNFSSTQHSRNSHSICLCKQGTRHCLIGGHVAKFINVPWKMELVYCQLPHFSDKAPDICASTLYFAS